MRMETKKVSSASLENKTHDFLLMGLVVQPKMRKELFNGVILPKMRSTFLDFNHSLLADVDLAKLEETQMLNLNGTIQVKDKITASYNGVNLEMFTLCITRHSVDDNSNSETLFYGQWMIFDAEKYRSYDKIICSSKFFVTSYFKIRDNKVKQFEYLKNANNQFTDDFIVEANDENEVKKILTNEVMDAIVRIKSAHPRQPMGFGFINGKLHVGIYSNQEMTPVISYRKLKKQGINNFVNTYIKNITDIVDLLHL